MKHDQNILKLGSRFVKRFNFTVMWLVCFLTSSSVLAIDIAQDPLFLKRTAIPNVMFILDDSGSMDWDILTKPHWPAWNYDHDYRRSWAKGGWIAWDITPASTKITNGEWHSNPGYCHDRNADGLCYNELYLNADSDRNDSEHTKVNSVSNTPDWGLVLEHWYFWEYPYGHCVMPPPPTEGGDASDWLPEADKLFALLTGSQDVRAHTGDFGPSSSPYQWNGSNHPSNQNTGGGAYREEVWANKGADYNTWEINNTYQNNATLKATCESNGGTWQRLTDYEYRILHHGPDLTGDSHAPRWGSAPWSFAASVDPLTGAVTSATPLNAGTGGYHYEYKKNFNPDITGRDRLDINGDGVGDDSAYNEADELTTAIVNYRYLNYNNPQGYDLDNVFRYDQYTSEAWRMCGDSDFKHLYTAAGHCPKPNDYMPAIYPYDSGQSAIDNPSGKVASSQYTPGKMEIVKIPTNGVVKRFIRSSDWVGSPTVNLLFPLWARGTRHAMSKHDPMPLVSDWRPRSADFNVLYYNPKSTYSPWPGLPSANFNAARSNPQPGTPGYSMTVDLARPVTEYGKEGEPAKNVEAGFVYEVWVDDAGYLPSVGKPEWKLGDSHCGTTGGYVITSADVAQSDGGSGIVDPATGNKYGVGEHICFSYLNYNPDGKHGNKEVDLWDSHYRVEVRNGDIKVYKVRRTPHLKGEALYTASVYNHSSHYYWDNDDTPAGVTVGSANYTFSNAELEGMHVAMSDTKILGTYDYNAIAANPDLCIKIFGEAPPEKSGICRSESQIKQNIANWYQYSRRRSFVAKGAIASLIKTLPNINYGLMGTSRRHLAFDNADATATNLTSDLSKLFRDVYDGKGSGNGDAIRATHNNNLINALYSYIWRRSATPLRQALQRAGEYFAGHGPLAADSGDTVDHNTSPITKVCQKSFAILITDGYWNGLAPATVSGPDRTNTSNVTLGDTDGDGYSKTLADVAKYYYDTDLRPSLANMVPPDKRGFDNNPAQHLTTIGISFGVQGLLTDPDEDKWPGQKACASCALPYTEASDWGDPDTAHPRSKSHNPQRLDDLWHAAYNGRGLFENASNPEQLINALKNALLIAKEKVGSGSAVTSNSQLLTSSTRLYQTIFESGRWTGDVKSYSLNTLTGQLITPAEWSAQTLLDARTASDRKIFTLGLTDGVPFKWTSLVDASSATASVPDQQKALRTRWATGTVESAAFGQAQLNYIRGASDPQFRSRTHKLGDIVHSEPLYVGAPGRMMSSFISEASSYPAFVTAHNSRKPMLYVGANDGMLHALDAQTGEEVFAYIPRVLIPKLNSLSHKDTTSKSFEHRYFVDDTPVTSDVYFSGAWHTVLVGGLRGGGKGIYALDVTTVPSSTDAESTIATEKGLWEFTDKDDADMGYSFSKPSIVRLNNGKWAAVFGNGYGSANGKAVLYIVEFKDGQSYGLPVHKFDTKVGSTSNENGLSTPTVIDTNGDGIADRVYAGDLLGNVWSWDISDSNETHWKTRFGTTATPAPLFTATDGAGGVQPITAAITVERHPQGSLAGYLLHFGTGKFFSATDNNDTGQVTQSVYAIWDYGVAGVTRSSLLQQQILAEPGYQSVSTVRVTSNNGPIQWMNTGYQVGDSGWQGHVKNKGWYMDLVNTEGGNTDNHGERVVSKLQISGPGVVFSTLLPSGDPCKGGGSGWRMALQKDDGARFDTPFLDISGDGLFTPDDTVNFNNGSTTEDVAVSGVKSEVGIPSMPLMLRMTNGNLSSISNSTTGVISKDDPGKDPKKKGPEGVLGVNGTLNNGRRSWIELR